jgi:TonB-linked SusC/RagA family outer membrane protein
MSKKFYLFLTILLIGLQAAIAQNINVTGTVLDVNGEPIVGANVVEKGTKNVRVTDIDGNFYFNNLKPSTTLVFSYVGMKTTELTAKAKMRVVLDEDYKQLDEVIVVAFGETKKSSFTGSATVVKSEDLEKRQLTNVFSGLQGQVAGLQVVDNSGDPNSTPSLRIRGLSSINASTDPLIIVDGAPYDGGWNNLNPNDVESVTVLKDAASNALYGARGANGVIMVTTKRGSAGEATISLDAKWGVNQRAYVEYDLIDDPAEYYEMFYKAHYNANIRDKGMTPYEAHVAANNVIGKTSAEGGVGYISYAVPDGQYLIGTNGKLNPNATLGNRIYYNGQVYTITPDDWKGEAFRNSLRQEYNLNVNGGTDRFNFYGSLGYLSNDGIIYNSDLKRYTARLKADYQAKKWLKVGANINYANRKQNNADTGGNSVFGIVTSMAPIYPIYLRDGDGNIMTDENGKMYDYGAGENAGLQRPILERSNFLQTSQLNMDQTKLNNFNATGYVDITPLEGLKITINGMVSDYESHKTTTTQPFYGANALAYPGGYVYKYDYQNLSLNFQQIVNYARDFGKHSTALMVGHEFYKYDTQTLWGSRQNMYSYFDSQDLNSAITILKNGNSSGGYNTEGYFTRALYDYAKKYYASISYRRDASSRFHPDCRWGNFYSFGGAWDISKEDWFKAPWVDMLKYKISWGQQGNDGIGDFLYTDTYEISNSGGNIGLTLYNVGNPDITWETNSNFNTGFDFELFKSRLSGTIEFFSRKTTDMLCYVYVPLSNGYNGTYDNIGDMLNRGVELSLDVNVMRTKDFTWNVNFNATHYRNKVTKLNEDNRGYDLDGHAGYTNGSYFVGEGLSFYTWRLKKYAGVNESGNSMWYYTDANGDLQTTTTWSNADYYYCGKADPDLYGGFGSSLSYKGIDFSFTFNYSIGGLAYDGGYASSMGNPSVGLTGRTYHRDLYKAWSEDNTSSDIPRFQYATLQPDITASYVSDRWLTNASSLTLQNINVGYTLPKKATRKLGLKKLRVYATADNIYYWSKRKGFDPRSSFSGTTSTTSYSPVRTITGGINVQF